MIGDNKLNMLFPVSCKCGFYFNSDSVIDKKYNAIIFVI